MLSVWDNRYHLSPVTEDELLHGLLQNSSPNDHCLCYCRNLDGITDDLSDPSVGRYCDVINNSGQVMIDKDAQRLLQDLKHSKISQVLGESNFKEYNIPWKSGGVDPQAIEHASYLTAFCQQVYNDLKILIDRAVEKRKVCDTIAGTIQNEILHHASFSHTKCESFCGRETTLASISDYLQSQIKRPLVIHGVSGTGKTSVMAAVANQVHHWLGAETVCMLRFLGTTPASSTVRGLLISISLQLCLVYGVQMPNLVVMEFNEVAQYFHTLLVEILPSKLTSKLVILLDSIDQLSSANGAHSMMWLPRNLPKLIYIVVSMLPKEHKCLETMHSLLPYDDSFLEVSAMPKATGLDIFNAWLSRAKRTVTAEQMSKVMQSFSDYPHPLFLRLLFHQALQWKSYTSPATLDLSHSTAEALSHIFSAVEEHHGKVLVQHSFAYLTGCHSGITEAELEDVLSLDDTVLSDVYQYWDPPVEGYIRIPSLLWKRIRHEVSDYLVERQADGKTVLAWYHRQFIETATKRYLSTSSEAQTCHSNLASYFEGYWSERPKPIHLFHRNITLNYVSRQVASQPLEFSEGVYNLRKLNEFPVHLILANQVDKLKKLVLCNHDWLSTKLKATSYISVIQDYNLAQSLDDTDISTVSEALALSAHNLKVNPSALAGQLVGRLTNFSSSHLHQLLTDAAAWVEQSQECQLLPVNSCLISPGSPLKMTLSGHHQVVESIVVSESLSLIVSASKAKDCSVINVWNLKSIKNSQNTLTLKIPGCSAPKIVLNGIWLAGSCATNVRVWKVTTGEEVCSAESSSPVTCLVSCADSPMVFAGLEGGGIMSISVQGGLLHQFNVSRPSDVSCITATRNADSDESYHVLTGHVDGALCIFKIVPNRCLLQGELFNHNKRITCLRALPAKVLHKHNCRLGAVTASEDGSMTVWDLESNRIVHVLTEHKKAIKCLQYLFREERDFLLFSGSLDNTIKIWNAESGSCLRTLTGHTNAIWCLSILNNGCLLISGSKDDYLKVWNIDNGACLHTLEGHSSWVSCVGTIQTSQLIISGSNDKSLKIWQLTPAQMSRMKSDRHNMQPECIIAVPSGLVVSGAPDAIKVWNALTGKCVHTFEMSASALAISEANPNWVISGGRDNTVSVWDLTHFSRKCTLAGHTGSVTQLLCMDNMILSSSADGTAKVWDIQKEICTHTFQGHRKEIKCMTLSTDYTLVTTGSYDCSARVWSLTSFQQLSCLEGHDKVVWCIAMSSDNKLVATGSDDTSLKIWNTQTETCTHTIKYSDSIKCLALTSDNFRVLAGAHCSNGQLKAWNIATGACLQVYSGHTHAVMCMLLTSDDRFLITGSRDGTIKVWEQATGTLLTSFDLQSQIKYISCIELSKKEALLAATTKSGPIAIMRVLFHMEY